MISSPRGNCGNRHRPKDKCMPDCEKIAAIQQFKHTMHTPPYVCNSFDNDLPTFVTHQRLNSPAQQLKENWK